jgi:hypothetical protein
MKSERVARSAAVLAPAPKIFDPGAKGLRVKDMTMA